MIPPTLHRSLSEQAGDNIPLRKLKLQRYVIASGAVLISILFLWMIADFLAMLFLAMVLTTVLQPYHDRLSAWLGNKPKMSVALLVGASILAVVIPAIIIFMVVLNESVALAGLVTPFVQHQLAHFQEVGLDKSISDLLPAALENDIINLQETIVNQVGSLANQVTPILVNTLKLSSGTVGGVLSATLSFLFLMYALVAFLLTGRDTFRHAAVVLPIPRHHRMLLVERAHSTIIAVAKGTGLIAVLQGTLTGVGLYVTGVPLAIFWGAVATLFSFIPVLGPPLIWGPATGWLFATGNPYAGLGLLCWGILQLVIALVLRPILVGKDAKMPDLMVLISSLGGISVFGGTGIFIGPMIAALCESAWFVFGQAFDDLLDDAIMPAEGEADEYAVLVPEEA